MARIIQLLILSAAALAFGPGPALARVRVLIVAGQSNAVGRGADPAALPDSLRAPREDIRLRYAVGPLEAVWDPARLVRSGGWTPLAPQTDPSGDSFGGPPTGFGPELMLGRRVAEATGDTTVIVKFAIGATALATDWSPSVPGSLFDRCAAEVETALAALAAEGHPAGPLAFFWMQGERDAQDPRWAAQYGANFAGFIAAVRSRWAAPAMPFVFGRPNREIVHTCCDSFPWVAEVRAAQEAVASTTPEVKLVDTDDLGLVADGVHFSAASQVELGARFAHALLAIPTRVPGEPVNPLHVWPNPGAGRIHVAFGAGASAPDGARLGVYDISGRRHAAIESRGGVEAGLPEWTFDTRTHADLRPGVYFLRVEHTALVQRLLVLP